jgi:hypothetical protein
MSCRRRILLFRSLPSRGMQTYQYNPRLKITILAATLLEKLVNG